jgi:hypothetical protein
MYAFENRVLRRIFGRKGDVVTGDRRKLHKERFRNLYCSLIVIRVVKVMEDEMGKACSTNVGEEERT